MVVEVAIQSSGIDKSVTPPVFPLERSIGFAEGQGAASAT
jgi:hypothetical protein